MRYKRRTMRDVAVQRKAAVVFGTAGLRGFYGPGVGCVDEALMRRLAAVLCRLLQAADASAPQRGVCIAFDGRRHSRALAEAAAQVVASRGFAVWLGDEPLPTPVLAFAVRHCGAAAGLVFTASHNPAAYHGVKLYGATGAQLCPPFETQLAEALAAEAPVAAPLPVALPRLPSDLADAYLAAIVPATAGEATPPLKVAYTALHGVGQPWLQRALQRWQADALPGAVPVELHAVAEQSEPDGDFPTAPSPNPELPESLVRVLALAEARGCDLALAHDPDADRLAVAVRQPAGGFRSLTGNEIGCLLAEACLLANAAPPRGNAPALVLSTLVSSPQLGVIAAAHGAVWQQTQTGFKWIMQRAAEQPQLPLAFAYEEALGFAVNQAVRDKDGISAALAVLQLALACRARGQTLLDALHGQWRRYGLALSQQVTQDLSAQPTGAEPIMLAWRSRLPTAIGGCKVLAMHDYLAAGSQPQADMLRFDLEGGHRIMLRPSGTEPKLKIYLDICLPLAADESPEAAEGRGRQLLRSLSSL